ncbi:hypothetical protein ACL598_18890 [Bordetella bronchialis]|uniref:hypothetical protein n=1 Tax=Bordetella bronchialis TaxID=463025 RepID=UPI003D060134
MFEVIRDLHYGDYERDLDKIDPAWAKAALYFRSDGVWHLGHGDSIRARPLLAIWQELEQRRAGLENGDTVEILHAIKTCAEENLPMPTWLANAYIAQFGGTLKPGGHTSLDAAFTSKHAPRTEAKRKAKLRDWQIGGRLLLAMWDAAKSDQSLSSFDAALEMALRSMPHLGVAKTKARELVRKVDRTQQRLQPSYQGISRFLERRRKQ